MLPVRIHYHQPERDMLIRSAIGAVIVLLVVAACGFAFDGLLAKRELQRVMAKKAKYERILIGCAGSKASGYKVRLDVINRSVGVICQGQGEV